MSDRELIVLGTASQVPTRERNHNGYVLAWDGEAILFDPGEGTQRQLTLAGFAPPRIRRICVTHVHGDHCFGLPGVLQRLALDGVTHEVELWYPAGGEDTIAALLRAAAGYGPGLPVAAHPSGEGLLDGAGDLRLVARRLDHRIETLGYRVEEPAGRRMLPDRLEALGVRGPTIGELQRRGRLKVQGRLVAVEEVSVARPGQVFAFVMDTRPCEAALALADGADLLVAEATFMSEHADLADAYGHLTVAQAAAIARDAGVRRLVLTHFSRRYPDLAERVRAEARTVFDGDLVVAEDLLRVPVPPRR